jgi:hypothetical protein
VDAIDVLSTRALENVLRTLLTEVTFRNIYDAFSELVAYRWLGDAKVHFTPHLPITAADLLKPNGSIIDSQMVLAGGKSVFFDVTRFGFHAHKIKLLQGRLEEAFPGKRVLIEGAWDVSIEALQGFPEDLRHAITICAEEHRELSCSLIWPAHVKTFGAVGLILKPRSTASISSISPHDSGTSFDDAAKREGGGVPFSREAVDETFANSQDYNEWTVTDGDTIGIFVNL